MVQNNFINILTAQIMGITFRNYFEKLVFYTYKCCSFITVYSLKLGLIKFIFSKCYLPIAIE